MSLLVCAAIAAGAPAGGLAAPPDAGAERASAAATPRWIWPGGVAEIVAPYEPPAHDFAAGHRGVDVAVAGDAVLAPDDGIVAFRGTVVDRPLITIDHGGALVSTLEPVASDLSPGDPVSRGSVVGTLASGGHAPEGALHLGARLGGAYIDPLGLLGALERPVLLPCC